MTKQFLKRFILTGLAASVLTAGLNFAVLPKASAQASVEGFDIVAHRGGRAARPENTLYAFAYAMEMGVTTMELDVQLTKDGALAVSHNATLHNELVKGPDGLFVTDDRYDIRTMTLEELKKFDLGSLNPASGKYYAEFGPTQLSTPGAKIPTLEEVFQLIKGYKNKDVIVNIEIKSYPDPERKEFANNPDMAVVVKKVHDAIMAYGMQNRVVVQSFDWAPVKMMKDLDPNITTAALSYPKNTQPNSPWMAGLNITDFSGNYIQAVHALGANMSTPEMKDVTPEKVAEAHALGLKIIPWTVNEKADMERLINMGVDGIITDKPWLLRDVLSQRGIAIPKAVVNEKSPYHTGTKLNGEK